MPHPFKLKTYLKCAHIHLSFLFYAFFTGNAPASKHSEQDARTTNEKMMRKKKLPKNSTIKKVSYHSASTQQLRNRPKKT
jgi:hypothetical protein